MPDPGSKRAPDYNSRYPKELEEFLEEFENLAKQYELGGREMSRMVVRYVDRETRACWKELDGYDEDYKVLKKKIMKAHRKARLEDHPVFPQLVKLIKKSAKGIMEDEDGLDTYYQKFLDITTELLEEQIISKQQQDEYFWNGLPQDL
ncbi:hypothetical protein BYT27DRAFT_7087875 [Phlegmacium glaucopus]|nr:hypothetical protein BYT27DRAFT_7087875 [Phlegmacium glaucopus]